MQSNKPIIVAEIAASHNGSLHRALETIKAAAEAGADMVKFQTFTPEQMVLDHNYVIKDGPWAGRKLIDLYSLAHTPRSWHQNLFSYAIHCGVTPFSTPFHKDDVDFLESLGCPLYKIASFELIDLELIRYVKSTGKQVILSTGMATDEEVISAMTAEGDHDPIILDCVSAYPANPEEIVMGRWNAWKWGISDHSKGFLAAVCATVKGAYMIEKHITLDHDGGLDDDFAMLPHEFKEMVDMVRTAAMIVDLSPEKIRKSQQAQESNRALRRSLYYAKDLPIGHVLTRDDFITARPALGENPIELRNLIGATLEIEVMKHSPV